MNIEAGHDFRVLVEAGEFDMIGECFGHIMKGIFLVMVQGFEEEGGENAASLILSSQIEADIRNLVIFASGDGGDSGSTFGGVVCDDRFFCFFIEFVFEVAHGAGVAGITDEDDISFRVEVSEDAFK